MYLTINARQVAAKTLELLSRTGRFPPPLTDERSWSPLIANMTVEQAATLKGLAEAAYELMARRIAVNIAKLPEPLRKA